MGYLWAGLISCRRIKRQKEKYVFVNRVLSNVFLLCRGKVHHHHLLQEKLAKFDSQGHVMATKLHQIYLRN